MCPAQGSSPLRISDPRTLQVVTMCRITCLQTSARPRLFRLCCPQWWSFRCEDTDHRMSCDSRNSAASSGKQLLFMEMSSGSLRISSVFWVCLGTRDRGQVSALGDSMHVTIKEPCTLTELFVHQAC